METKRYGLNDDIVICECCGEGFPFYKIPIEICEGGNYICPDCWYDGDDDEEEEENEDEDEE